MNFPPATTQITTYLKNHVGLVVGLVLGLLSGLGAFGAAIGILVGYLADELVRDQKIRRRAAAVLQNPRKGVLDDHWTKTTVAIGLACTVATRVTADRPESSRTGSIDMAEAELLKSKITEHLGLNGRRAGLARVLIGQVLSGSPIQVGAVVELYRSLSAEIERTELLKLLFSVAQRDHGHISAEQLFLVKKLSIDLQVQAEQYNAIRRQISGFDSSPYEILGLSPDATDTEIKRIYHRLAAQFHPDTGTALGDHRLEQSSEAFMRIKNAYNRIIEDREAQR